jgi:DNA-binding transcriptional MocR family regulator
MDTAMRLSARLHDPVLPQQPAAPLYLRTAQALERQIQDGALKTGERVPSIRSLSRQQGVSISTVLQAYMWMESRGLIEARPQSGFYVAVRASARMPEPTFRPGPPEAPTEVTVGEVIEEIVHHRASMSPSGAALGHPSYYPVPQLNRLMRAALRDSPETTADYQFPGGHEELRRQIARRALAGGCNLAPSEVLITHGAMEALNIAIRTVANPGDAVAVESPTFFGILQIFESLGMRAVEVPTHPQTGIDLRSLETSIRRHRIKACLVMANCHNPLGYVMSDSAKQDLVNLTHRHDLPLIEDDVYGELMFDTRRRRALKAFDRKGLVLQCSSFSKILAPGLRIGWITAGRFLAKAQRLKFMSSGGNALAAQMAVAGFLKSNAYDRHLRKLRVAFQQNIERASQLIAEYFPEGTRISRPAGGLVLWVELPRGVKAMTLYRQARQQGISIIPGPLFSANGNFTHHFRLSCGYPWSDEFDRSLRIVGDLAGRRRA